MKKKCLFLSLCMGGIAIVFLVVFAIVTLVPHSVDPIEQISSAVNEGNNKGSEEDPYYIYDTETFVTLLSTYGSQTKPVREKVQEIVYENKVDEEGNVVLDAYGDPVQVEKLDEYGNVVKQDVLDENGYAVYVDVAGETEVYHFKFLADVDFSGVDFVTLFNNGESFIGVIDGDGKVVKNISISVNKDNLENFMYVSSNEPKEYSSHIAVFGNFDGAVLTNISFENINVNVDDEVISYLKGTSNDYFGNDYSGSFKEFVVSSVVAYAEDSTINANVSATINSDAYAVYSKGTVSGINSVGGVVGYSINSVISSYSESDNVVHNITIVSDGGNRGYYLGGVAGYLYKSQVSKVTANVSISAISSVDTVNSGNILYIGGIAGYILGSDVENSIVTLSVSQTEESHLNLEGVTSINNDLYNKVGGVASIIRANDDTQISNISNVKVTTDIDMDCLFGGVVYEVRSETYLIFDSSTGAYRNKVTSEETDEDKSLIFVTMTDLIVSSNVNVIKAYGIGAILCYTDIVYSDGFVYASEAINGKEVSYNLKLTGSVSLSSNSDVYSAFIVSSNSASGTLHFTLDDIRLVYSDDIESNLQALDVFRINYGFGNSVRV